METFSWNKTTWAASTWFRGGHNVESGWLEPVFKNTRNHRKNLGVQCCDFLQSGNNERFFQIGE